MRYLSMESLRGRRWLHPMRSPPMRHGDQGVGSLEAPLHPLALRVRNQRSPGRRILGLPKLPRKALRLGTRSAQDASLCYQLEVLKSVTHPRSRSCRTGHRRWRSQMALRPRVLKVGHVPSLMIRMRLNLRLMHTT